jgi:hypothetical protein
MRAKKAAKQLTAVGRVGDGKIGSKSAILGVTLQQLREKRELVMRGHVSGARITWITAEAAVAAGSAMSNHE